MELCQETGWPHFVIRGVFSSWSFYERQSHKLARPIGWLGLYERKYSPLAGDEVLLKNFEPFLRNWTTNIDMSCKLIDVYRHIRLFPFIEVSRNANQLARPIGWLGWGERKYSPLSRDEVLLKNFEPFLRNIDSYGVMSGNRLATFRY